MLPHKGLRHNIDVLGRMHHVLRHTGKADRIMHGVKAMPRYDQAFFIRRIHTANACGRQSRLGSCFMAFVLALR
ncbi:hypothetical protein Amal_03886 [Acetobacter malorum]|uniref:Uncharacterized protein n=1 Tax=Acetobacter malorum TaxID=178901 RepID=A0A177G3S1_9PROT|nr:hypothetical protein Amal_03886 [Acetobacter malorum]